MYLTFYCPLQNQIISLKQNKVHLYSSTKILKTKNGLRLHVYVFKTRRKTYDPGEN